MANKEPKKQEMNEKKARKWFLSEEYKRMSFFD
jgi:hypothetical protein